MNWTDEMIDRAAVMWNDHKSCRQIGKELGLSKNAVVGKLYRLGITGQPRTGTPEPPEELEQPVEDESLAEAHSREATGRSNSRICVTPDCRGPKQPGRDICATCITKAYVARRDAA